jgi:hypothetical protein
MLIRLTSAGTFVTLTTTLTMVGGFDPFGRGG